MTSMRYIILSVSILVLVLASHFHPTSAHQHEHEDQRVLASLGRRILSLPTEFDTDNSSKIRVQIKKGMRFVPRSRAGAGAGAGKTRSSAAPTTTNRHVSSSLYACSLLGFFFIFTRQAAYIESRDNIVLSSWGGWTIRPRGSIPFRLQDANQWAALFAFLGEQLNEILPLYFADRIS
ncbi:unnamed protein product [Camellia sinensis]